jgi:small GTP-binding protein
MKSIDEYDEIIKIIIIGDSNVGKTAILNRFCENKYSNNVPSTLGLQYAEKAMVLSAKKVLFQIWDTAGQ